MARKASRPPESHEGSPRRPDDPDLGDAARGGRASRRGQGVADALRLARLDLHERLPGLVVDLQRRVADAEALVQQRLQLAAAQVAVVVGGDDDVRGEREEARR